MKKQIKATLSWETLDEMDVMRIEQPVLSLSETEETVSQDILFFTGLVNKKPIFTDTGEIWYNREYRLSIVTDIAHLDEDIEQLYKRFESFEKKTTPVLDCGYYDMCREVIDSFRDRCNKMKLIELKKLNGTPIKASRKEIMQELRHESQISRMMM